MIPTVSQDDLLNSSSLVYANVTFYSLQGPRQDIYEQIEKLPPPPKAMRIIHFVGFYILMPRPGNQNVGV
ncbi:hypothetical protein GWI33_000216 [Rhynchophorus ferrugineus]|uniref:Uncharacterized protein n=1 Tax=Rhynchophorus ferrugineus TaxID=354439 RepID=A0A834IY17_RHYFE|nr:hypothetical protein GWI33_000216 [Rhynchophorus ferrugineus]